LATFQEIASAGFNYLEDHDKVKCWYWNTSLENWEKFDRVWHEHVKWFHLYELVLKNKGIKFVKQAIKQHPDIFRPKLSNAVTCKNI